VATYGAVTRVAAARCVAVLNEVVWRTQPDAVWVWFRMPGLPALAALFAVSQVPSMLKDAKALEAKKAAEEALRNAKGKLDQAAIQSELAIQAAQIAALRKFLKK